MKIIADLHTHTSVSSHAFSSIDEMTAAAEKAGLTALAMTNHGYGVPDSAFHYHFGNMGVLPRKNGVITLLRGVEANVMDFSGTIDISPSDFNFDITIASMHGPIIKPGKTKDDYTSAWLGVIDNPNIDILGHMGRSYDFYIDPVVKAAAERGKVVEINNHSLKSNPKNEQRCFEILSVCKKYGVRVAANSDAHHSSAVGRVPLALALLKRLNYPEELVVNCSIENLSDFLNSRPNKSKILF